MQSRTHCLAARALLQKGGVRLVVQWLAVAAGYGLLVLLSFQVAAPARGMVTLWLPAGFALAVLLHLGFRVWPGIALGLLLPVLLLENVPYAMAWFTPGTVVGPLLVAWAVRRWVPRAAPLSRVADISRFIVLVSLVTLPVAMAEAALWHGPGGGARLPTMVEWWLGNAAGMLIFTPFVLGWSSPLYAPPAGRRLELAALAVLVLLVANVVFSDILASGALEYILLVFFIWAALRLDIRGMTTLTLITALAAAYHTARGHGPFIAPSELMTQLSLQGFAVIGTVTGLMLIAATHERSEAQEGLQLAGMVIDNTPNGVMITDADLRIRSVNPAFTTTTGYTEAEVLGKSPRLLASGRHDAAFYQEMWRHIDRHGRWQGEIWNRRKNGEIYLEWLEIFALRDPQGRVLHYAGIFSDIVTQEHVRKRLHSLAYYDALTDLPNRELFHDRLHNALVQARRERHSLGLMFIDLDRFKQINDSLGHAVGDSVLRAVAEVLRQCVRESDTVARLGGDEFTVILPSVAGTVDVVEVARKITTAFARPLQVEGHALNVGVSIGTALYPEDAGDEASLLRNADAAMYSAKRAGRNTYRHFTPTMAGLFFSSRGRT